MNTKQKQILAWVLLSCGVIIAGVILGGITGKFVLGSLSERQPPALLVE